MSRTSKGTTVPRLSDHAFERLLDAHLDGELTPQARKVLEAELANSPERRGQFERSERLLLAMRTPAESPDLSSSILDRLEDRGVLLPSRKRRTVFWTRVAAAAAIAMGIGALVLVERQSPGTTPMASTAPEPVRSVVEASKTAVDVSTLQVREAVRTIQSELLPQATLAIRTEPAAGSLGLKLGNTSKNDRGIRWNVGSDPVKSQILATRQESALSAILSEPDNAGLWLGMDIDPAREKSLIPPLLAAPNAKANRAQPVSGTAPAR